MAAPRLGRTIKTASSVQAKVPFQRIQTWDQTVIEGDSSGFEDMKLTLLAEITAMLGLQALLQTIWKPPSLKKPRFPLPSDEAGAAFVKTPHLALSPTAVFVYTLAHLAWGKFRVLPLPPSPGNSTACIKRIFSGLSNNLLEAMETDLIGILINLSLPAKQNQEAKGKGAGFFFLSQDMLLSPERVHCVFLGTDIFPGESSRISSLHPNTRNLKSKFHRAFQEEGPCLSLAYSNPEGLLYLIHFGSFPEQLTN